MIPCFYYLEKNMKLLLYFKQMVKKKSNAPRQHIRLMEKSFQKNLLDAPLKEKEESKISNSILNLFPSPYNQLLMFLLRLFLLLQEKTPFLFLEMKKRQSLILECKS